MTHRILFVVDGGPRIGGGHLMRCRTLAEALRARGARTDFVVPSGAAAIAASVLGGGWERAGPGREAPLVRVAAPGEDLATSAAAFADAIPADALVFDGYALAAADETRAARGRPVLALDDLADRPHACDLLVDSGLGRAARDYAGLVPDGATVLAGPGYAPIREDFARARPAALARREAAGPVSTVLVSLGLTDLGGVSGRVARTLAPLLGPARMVVALGGGAPSLAALEAMAAADARLDLRVDAPDMAALCAEADIAVGAGGGSAWERATLGLPALTLVLADNQRRGAERMAAAGATLPLAIDDPDFETVLARSFRRLTGEPALRRGLAARSAALCDGLGAGRVAEALLARL
ncbi:MAG: UDP-2,4-diacetamido-2,4,6-trideoxy-beta-L-altropyranose hydrolase [Caulobacteraceae bacterium]|nr:UDP-2,4-diacetamido-2,4,6-trideoxy-beta-L-altropyranose hydrolase [Caulobacteraceae bacterium]